jgi:hypothetical protein
LLGEPDEYGEKLKRLKYVSGVMRDAIRPSSEISVEDKAHQCSG